MPEPYMNYITPYVCCYRKIENSRYRSIVDLVEDAIAKSKDSVFCYVKPTSQLQPPFPVRLTNPLSHFGDISTLQNMCRLVIQKHVDNERIDSLPLPHKLIAYCKEWGTINGDPVLVEWWNITIAHAHAYIHKMDNELSEPNEVNP